MGSSKFTFPLPGRKSKPAPPPITTAAPLTKAQKILGTGGISTDSPTHSDSRWWDVRSNSNSGISVAVESETTASHTEGRSGLGSAYDNRSAGSPRRQWDESEIIPRDQANLLPPAALHDGVTDASSLRRRQSSSTITSYYDKSKLPLSISQQTSSSAMAKGLPTKAQALLDMDSHSESRPKKKKPARLDLSALLPRSRASKAKHLKPDSHRGLVLGPDLMTKSPSVMSVSPADSAPPPIQQRTDRSLRKKLTRESLTERPPPPEAPQQRQPPAGTRREVPGRSEGGRPGHRPTKSTVNLLNLYDHYEQRTFADVIEQDLHSDLEELALPPGHQMPAYPSPTVSTLSGVAHLSPLGSNPVRPPQPTKQQPPLPTMGSVHDDLSLATGAGPLSLISPPGDNASVSSRHTRTSKASRRTDLSLTDLDLQQNSMLSLSSDSEDDNYEPSSRSALAVPRALSDGQASPTSPRSAISHRSAPTVPQDVGRSKQPKRTSFASSPQFLPIPEGAATAAGSPPKISARTSSLLTSSAAKKHASSLAHQTSRLSIATVSTSRTVSYSLMPHTPGEGQGSPGFINTPPQKAGPADPRFGSFPTPPPTTRRSARPSPASISSEQPTPPLSPTSVDFYLQSQQSSRHTFDQQSVRSSSKSVSSSLAKPGSVSGAPSSASSSASAPWRGSAVSSVQEITAAGSGRFMAVTRQEEMLLAALRLKRARMREDIIAEFEDELDREEANTLSRQVTGDSSMSMSGVSRQSSLSTMRNSDNSMGTLSARPQQQQKPPRPQIRISTGSNERIREPSLVSAERTARGQILLMMDRPTEHSGLDTAEPSPDLDDFLGFDDENLEFPMQHASGSPIDQYPEQRRSSRASSKASLGSISGASSISQRPSLSATTSGTGSGTGSRSNQLSKENLYPRRGSGQSSRRGSSDLPVRILEDPREEEGVPRADSPPLSPCSFPTPTAMTRKKQVRLSAVGNYKPNVEAGWWDDSG
ncbi:hypothetical protein B0H67DRAFT_556008 [Lasiosphaeris hirsuta]|uniref:Uncharacterized protein n=1 Tax=Lasiosphaeris hirsuta TaxID=260670 RepID=A0AA40A142_9PEZI|nr:hypothetical protein B0H67DRAFT_556008 [Lasiosphaeris hirsuta]